jgi:serine/threonine protein kinase
MQNEQFDQQSLLPLGVLLQMGKYRVERYLSSGGFGNTYVITNLQFDEQYAMKEFFMKGINERNDDNTSISVSNKTNRHQFEQQREKFKKEARRLRKLHNKHIVQVHDLFEENGTAYYVMDFVDGESLSERIKRTGKQFSEQEALQILSQILDALKTVHEKGIWHLDLKPGNIMVDKSGNTVLIDFGASKQMSSSDGYTTTMTAMCYTQGYAPPEQIDQNMSLIGPWTDLYALGATLYYIMTMNQPPMVSEMFGTNAFSYPIPVSKKIQYLIRWMMKPNREGRPQSVEEVLEFLKVLYEVDDETTNSIVSNEETQMPETIDTWDERSSINWRKWLLMHAYNTNITINWKKWLPLVAIGIVLLIGIVLYTMTSKSGSVSKEKDSLNVERPKHIEEIKNVEKMYFDSPLGLSFYTGTVDEDQKPHGSGEVTFTDRRIYRGPLNHGNFEGNDAYFIYDNGDTFEGSFVNNSFSKGRYTIKEDSSYFIGTFKNGQPDKGTWYDKNGNIL